MLWKYKQNVGHIRKRGAAAKARMEQRQKKKRKQNLDRNVTKKVVARNGFSSDEESSAVETERDEEEQERESDDAELEVEDEDEDELEVDDTEEIDNNDCNARPCLISILIKNKKTEVNWVRCCACPKWFHQLCVGVGDDDLTFKCHNH